MDAAKLSPEAASLAVQGPHWHRHSLVEPPVTFTPLRLVLQASGYAFEVTRPEILIGRHSHADIRLPLPDVSRRHCRLVFAAGCWQVFDLNSLNGLFVNGQQIREAVLKHGDSIRVGGFTIGVDLLAQVVYKRLPLDKPELANNVLKSIFDSLPQMAQDSKQRQRRAS